MCHVLESLGRQTFNVVVAEIPVETPENVDQEELLAAVASTSKD